MKPIYSLLAAFLGSAMIAGAQDLGSDQATSTRSAVRSLMERRVPKLQFDTTFTASQFKEWQNNVQTTMKRLVKHPDKEFASPKFIKKVKRKGYTVEKWNSYPMEGCVVPFLVLIPDGVDSLNKAPAALCIPGFGQSKELLAGERIGNYSLEGDADTVVSTRNMARHLVEQGIIALAIDNPSCGELSDNGVFDYLVTSRFLLENGWSYLGLSSWQDRVALNHLRNRPDADRKRLIVSGFSLGTEPLMVVGALEPDVYAFVYNDILCRTRERILVVDKPDEKGIRNFPNSDEHLVPEFLNNFDFPDLVSNLAPRPVICTEGGMERDFNIIKKAYELSGHPENFHHLTYHTGDMSKINVDKLPTGLSLSDFYTYLYVSPGHYYKVDKVVPWLKTQLSKE